MGNIQSQSTSNPCSISQKAAVAALRVGDAFTKQMVAEFDRRRHTIIEGLNAIPGISCAMPGGAFYAFPNIRGVLGKRGPTGPVNSPSDLAAYLLKDAHIAVVPGEPFGSESHMRLSYATSMETIVNGLKRLRAALAKLS
jgi:aspartate aminotransferase